jgi:hypothetical protein
MNNWIIRIMVAVGVFVSVNAANATAVDRGEMNTVCSHHGGVSVRTSTGQIGCSWCGTKHCIYYECDTTGCSRVTAIAKQPPKGVGRGGIATPISKPAQTPPPSGEKAGPSRPVDTRPIGLSPGGSGGKLK